MQFFSSDKRLQEIFFQNHPPLPPPSRVKWSAPNEPKQWYQALVDNILGLKPAIRLSFFSQAKGVEEH